MSLRFFSLVLQEKPEREFTVESSLFSVPSMRRWWSMPTFPALFCMNSQMRGSCFPMSERNLETAFLDSGISGCRTERKESAYLSWSSQSFTSGSHTLSTAMA